VRRAAAGEVEGAVHRVDDPRTPRGAGPRRALLPHDRVVGTLGRELLDDEALGGGVGLRHDVGSARLALDVEPFGTDPRGQQGGLADEVGGERCVALQPGVVVHGATVAGGVLWQDGATQASY
jgi:hypothetical protein